MALLQCGISTRPSAALEYLYVSSRQLQTLAVEDFRWSSCAILLRYLRGVIG
jgi:hypothetical protein